MKRRHTPLITVPLILLTCSYSNAEPVQSRYLDKNPEAGAEESAEAEIRMSTPQPLVALEIGVVPNRIIKGSFVNVTYTRGALPVTTTGDNATFDPEGRIITYYSIIQQGSYKGFKKYYQCAGRAHYAYPFFDYEAKFRSGEMERTRFACNVRSNNDRFVPEWMNVIDKDGFLFSKVTFQF